ncbi:MAG: SPOR domain-containing protein [Pseudomonadales bacterium]
MAMDSAKTKSKARNATPRKKPAARSKKSGTTPGWVWFVTGLALGLFISFLYQLVVNPASQTPAEVAENPGLEAEVKEESNKPETRFNFYALLPETEVMVREVKEEVASPTTASEPEEKVLYYLQAGSFRTQADAEQRRAELGLLGFPANLEKFQHKSDTWHRVHIGPIESRSKLADTRSKLIEERIETMVIKRKAS